MRVHRQRFEVPFSYEIVFCRDVFEPDNDALDSVLPQEKTKMLVFLDHGVASAVGGIEERIGSWLSRRCDRIDHVGDIHTVHGGERAKDGLDVVMETARLCARYGMDRHAFVLIVGGGAVLDAVGLGCSLVHRGLRQIRVPTTTLSQADSGVGVKNGINAFGMKNFLGCFVPPWAVVIDTSFLEHLPPQAIIDGLSEAFKVAIIKDEEFLEHLVSSAGAIRRLDMRTIEGIVQRTAMIHAEHIASCGDPFERGSARPLDFGHWAAHRLEASSNYRIAHGRAVAIGLGVDILCASMLGLIANEEALRILDAMKECGMTLWDDLLAVRSEDGRLDVLNGLEEFRQHLGGSLTLAMPDGLGKMCFVDALPEEYVCKAVGILRERYST